MTRTYSTLMVFPMTRTYSTLMVRPREGDRQVYNMILLIARYEDIFKKIIYEQNKIYIYTYTGKHMRFFMFILF